MKINQVTKLISIFRLPTAADTVLRYPLAVLLISLILLISTGCRSNGTESPALSQYVNDEFSYSVEYRDNWIFEKLNPNEIRIKPDNDSHNQVQIGAWKGAAGIKELSNVALSRSVEATIKQFLGMLSAKEIKIFPTERSTGKWDCVTQFTYAYENTPLNGVFRMKDTVTNSYTAIIVSEADWPEGLAVVNSFSIITSDD